MNFSKTTFKHYFYLLSLMFFISCGGSSTSEETNTETASEPEQTETKVASVKPTFTGTWRLVNLEFSRAKKAFDPECDGKSTWNFTEEPAEDLSDGTKTMKFVVDAPEGCKFYGTESSWTTLPEASDKVFIKSVKVAGMGGVSLAGLMTVKELSDTKLTLESFGNVIYLER